MAAAQAQQRRRAEQLLAGEPGLQLDERPLRAGGVGPAAEDPHEVAERRVAEGASALELAGKEAGHVVTGGKRDGARVGLERLDDHPARCVAAAPPGELRQELERALL